MNDKLRGRFVCFAVVILLMVWRCPAFLVEPRFWAEEGKYYFSSAYNNGFLHGIFAQHFGYFSLVPNAATAIATLFPLEVAPLFTTYTALFFQILVCSLIVFGHSPFWETVPRKLFISSGILLLAPGEVWMTTICTQYWLTIAVFALLMEPVDLPGSIRNWYYRIVLLVAGLTSVASSFMIPLYVLKAIRTREREMFVQASILISTALLQAGVLLSSMGNESHLSSRFGGNDFSLAKLSLLQLVWPFVGHSIFENGLVIAIDEWFYGRGLYLVSMPRFSEFASASAISLLVIVLAWRYRKNREKQLIIGAFLLTAALTTLLSIRMASSPRYVFAPSVMLLVIFVDEYYQKAVLGKICVSVLLAVFVISGTLNYRRGLYYNTFWPKWKDEVAIWRAQPGYELMIWPQFRKTRWTMELKRSE